MPDPMPHVKPRRPRWHRRPEARREEILDAAYGVFGEHGFTRTKLDDVARRAGVSKGTLYLYFDSKDTLFREMVRAKILPCIVEGEELLRTHQGTARELLVALMRRMWSVVRTAEMARIGRLVQSELGNFPELAAFYFDEVIIRSRRLFQTAIDRGVASREFRRAPHQFVTRAITSLLVHAGQYQCFFGPLDPDALSDDEVANGVIDFVLHGVLARPAQRTKD
jgi:AcrR family transcriptional regulator